MWHLFSQLRKTRSAPAAQPSVIRSLGLQQLEDRRLLAVVNMTSQEQLLLELVNRQRSDPEGEAAIYGIDLNADLDPGEITPEPKQPVAPNSNLTQGARGHSDNMLDRDFFAHIDPKTGTDPSDRAQAAGYPAGAGENISWRGEAAPLDNNAVVYEVHEDLFRSEGHRRNTMTQHYRELGNGVRYGFFRTENDDGVLRSYNSIMVTENFGNRGGNAFITGVAYTDQVQQNNFYEIGEGIAGASIQATNTETGAVFTATTGSSGGYVLQVPDGSYRVKGSGTGMISTTFRNVVIDGVNQKVDFNSRNRGFASISGRVFEDLNSNGLQDAGESLLANQTIKLGNNYEGAYEQTFATATTDDDGFFEFTHLPSEPYRVFIDLAANRLSTSPDDGQFEVVLLPGQDANTLAFGVAGVNEPPVAVTDVGRTFEGVSVEIDVAANDTDVDNQVDRSSIEITITPLHGSTRIDESTQKVVYVPNDGFHGADVFGYTIKDVAGAVSELGRVDVFITPGVGLMWQNQANPRDVNGDTELSPIDPLQVINFLIRNGPQRLTSTDTAPPPYLDVSGDGSVTAIDALQVLNELIRQSRVELASVATADTELFISAPRRNANYAAAIDAVWLERDRNRNVKSD